MDAASSHAAVLMGAAALRAPAEPVLAAPGSDERRAAERRGEAGDEGRRAAGLEDEQRLRGEGPEAVALQGLRGAALADDAGAVPGPWPQEAQRAGVRGEVAGRRAAAGAVAPAEAVLAGNGLPRHRVRIDRHRPPKPPQDRTSLRTQQSSTPDRLKIHA